MASARKMISIEIFVSDKIPTCTSLLANTSQPGLLLLNAFCWVLGMIYSCRDPCEQHPSMTFLGIDSWASGCGWGLLSATGAYSYISIPKHLTSFLLLLPFSLLPHSRGFPPLVGSLQLQEGWREQTWSVFTLTSLSEGAEVAGAGDSAPEPCQGVGTAEPPHPPSTALGSSSHATD